MATKRLASHFCWNLEVLQGKTGAPQDRRADNYRILNPSYLLLKLRPKIEVLRVPFWLRFGNAVQQLTNTFLIAEQLRAEGIQFGQLHPFFDGERAGDFKLFWQGRSPSAPTLEGEFFNVGAFRVTPSPTDTARIFTELVRPLIDRAYANRIHG